MTGVLLRGTEGVDFPALAADGIRFAVLAPRERSAPPLPAPSQLAAGQAGIGLALLWDLRAASVADALSEADRFRRMLASLNSPPLWAICRLESPAPPENPSLSLYRIGAFLERIRGAGFRPMLATTEAYLKKLPHPLLYPLYLARWSVPEVRALVRNPRIWEYGEGRAGNLSRVPLLRGYFSSLPESGRDFFGSGNFRKNPIVQ